MRGAANEYFTTLILLDVRQLALSFVKLCKGETQVCYDPSKEPPRSREEDPCERNPAAERTGRSDYRHWKKENRAQGERVGQ